MERLVLVLASLFLVQGQYNYDEPSTVIKNEADRVRGFAYEEGADFVLGGLFPVHSGANEGAGCGDIRTERSVERVEAMLYALDLINDNDTLLPNIRLGFDIRDTCTSENLGLDEALDLTLTGELDSCTGSLEAAGSNYSVPSTIVIGAAFSAVSVPVATLLRLFRVPQISYSSTSARLNNRDRYTYFYRAISADNLQAEAMIDICLRFNWTYVSTIYTDDFYGEPGIDQFHSRAQETGICIDINEGIRTDFGDSDYYELAKKLLNTTADVVVLFANSQETDKLFEQLEKAMKNGTSKRFQWIASDGWARSNSAIVKYNTTLSGLFGTVPSTSGHSGFHDYFSQLRPDNNIRDAWFQEFYEAIFDCNLTGSGNETCGALKSITESGTYQQGSFIPLVVDAVFSAAHTLHNFLEANCDQPIVWYQTNRTCAGQRNELTGANLLGFLSNLTFTSPTGNKVSFDANGNPPGVYNIINLQKSQSTDEFKFAKVGTWSAQSQSGERLQLNDSMARQFGLRNEDNAILDRPRESQCHLCQEGQYMTSVIGSCCGRCVDCLGNMYSTTRTADQCSVCGTNYWGNDPLNGSTSCVEVEEVYLKYSHAFSIILMILAIGGVLAVVFVTVVFGLYWNTPIVKSSGREQMILLLIGITLSFVLTFIFVSKPSTGVCFFQRLGLWLSFSIILGALLVKLIRIARIFLRGQASSRPRFISPPFQLFFTFLVVAGKMVLVVFSMSFKGIYPVSYETLQPNPDDTNDFPSLILTCNPHSSAGRTATLILLVIYDSAIMIACNVLAVMTIRFPENFNESKYVAFTTFALGLIWLAFVSTFFSTVDHTQTAIISLALNLSAFAVLVCMFGARVFIILFHPSRNVATFTTNTKPSSSEKRPSINLNALTLTSTIAGDENDKNAGEFICVATVNAACAILHADLCPLIVHNM